MTSTNYKKEAKLWVYSLQYVSLSSPFESGWPITASFFLKAVLLGPALAPLAGGTVAHFFFCYCSYLLSTCVGFATHYYSWRIMQLLIGLIGFLVFFLILFFLPETYHPNKRGVDNFDPSLLSKWRPVILNPFQPLWLLRSPNILLVVRILFSSYHFRSKVSIGTSLWLALRFCSLTLVCVRASLRFLLLMSPLVLLVPLAYTIVSLRS